MEKGVPIRSISRSIAVLQVMNRHNSVTLTEVARAAGLPYPTVCRIVQTLIHEGLVDASPQSKHYHVTSLVQSLSLGYRDGGRLVESARPVLVELTREHAWPIKLTSPVGESIVVRDSTCDLSALTLSRYAVGQALPALECAPGHVHLAFTDEDTRECFIAAMAVKQKRSLTIDMFRSGKLTQRIREDGFALHDRSHYGEHPGKTSTIAVPVMAGSDKAGELSLTYFSTAFSASEARRKYANVLIKAGERIGAAFAQTGAAS